MKELTVPALTNNLTVVLEFVREELEKYDCSVKVMMQIELAVEEIFVNIVNYAYDSKDGEVKVTVEMEANPLKIIIKLDDQGKEYNPLLTPEPDVTESVEKRKIGGLGILLTKRIMDEIEYTYENGHNILMIKKNI